MDPVYDIIDLDDNGLIDNPGKILFIRGHVSKDNYSLGVGFSDMGTPTDKLQELCKTAAAAQIELNQQLTNKKPTLRS